jgi:hypothetical protein
VITPLRASARVSLTVEVTTSDCWGATCTIDQVRKQATEGAISRLARQLQGIAGLRIVGDPKVTTVIVTDAEG